MPEENVRFLFTFSKEATAELMAGNVSISSGGLRKANGTMLELAKPVLIDPSEIVKMPNHAVDELLEIQIRNANRQLDQLEVHTQELSKIAWMNYAVNCRTYEMTYQGFQAVMHRLDSISAQFSDFQLRLDTKEFNDTLERNHKHKNNLQTIADVMERKNFNVAMEALNIEPILNEIQAYFERLFSELKEGLKTDQLLLRSIVLLLEPYCYVVRRYSALYYYENEAYPANFQIWIATISHIIYDPKFKNRMKYHLRVHSDLTFEDVLIVINNAMLNLRGLLSQIDFDRRYVLCHSKEQYLSMGKQFQEKIASNDYQIIQGHLCVEL